jgi:hypothetical protein
MFGFGKRGPKRSEQADVQNIRFVMAHMVLLISELMKAGDSEKRGMEWLSEVSKRFYVAMKEEYGEEAAHWGRMALGLILVDVQFSRHVAANAHHIGPNLEIHPSLERDIMMNLSQV